MISGVVVTRNSQDVIFDCLESLQELVNEIVIVDLESTDSTLEVAAKFNPKVYNHQKVNFVEQIRQFAINKASGEWVVLLDPDERLTSSLVNELKNVKPEIAAVNIPRKNVFFGQWVRHTNFWPDRQIRFFQKDKITWSQKIHSYPSINGKVLNINATPELAIVHLGYDNFTEFFGRQNRYSTVEAQSGQFKWTNIIWQPLREFLVRFVKHQGFKDGFLGLSLVYSLMIYQLMVQVKLWEKTRK